MEREEIINRLVQRKETAVITKEVVGVHGEDLGKWTVHRKIC